jgi:hypothetical protein
MHLTTNKPYKFVFFLTHLYEDYEVPHPPLNPIQEEFVFRDLSGKICTPSAKLVTKH